MTWPKLVSFALHLAFLGWLFQSGISPEPRSARPPVLLAEIVEPIRRPAPRPAPQASPQQAARTPARRAEAPRTRAVPRVAKTAATPDSVDPLPIPAAAPHAAPTSAPGGVAATMAGREPSPIYRPRPEYPQRALRSKREGAVVLEFSIDVDGRVQKPRVVSSEPEGLFDRAALKALLQWRYEPQILNGVAVTREKVRVRLQFKLDRARARG